jgi:hypothetical protein
MELSRQDTETPTELLISRLNFHREMMENMRGGSEKYAHHEKMMKRFSNAISYLEDFEREENAV